jgi:nucleoside-diphosphate-sugar epimerase
MIRFAGNLARGLPIEVHKGSARAWLHVADAVRAIEAAAHVDQYAAINIGHTEVVLTTDLASMIRAELDADPALIRETTLPSQMTLVKRPTLYRQQSLLGFEPEISLAEGVRRVCAYQRMLVNRENSAEEDAESVSRRDRSRAAGTPMEAVLTPAQSRLGP